jgi:hypothetical protein
MYVTILRLYNQQKRRKHYLANQEKEKTAAKAWREAHPGITRLRRHERTAKIRLIVFSFYGKDGRPECARCGETTLAFLTLHHVDNDGVAERRYYGLAASSFYEFLIKHLFPAKFHLQTCCYNCNFLAQLDVLKARRATDAYHAKMRQHWYEVKARAVAFYSGGTSACYCCGISDIRLLEFDHIEAARARRNGPDEPRNNLRRIDKYYNRHGAYPPGYRVACKNCNSGTGTTGVCPHKSHATMPLFPKATAV